MRRFRRVWTIMLAFALLWGLLPPGVPGELRVSAAEDIASDGDAVIQVDGKTLTWEKFASEADTYAKDVTATLLKDVEFSNDIYSAQEFKGTFEGNNKRIIIGGNGTMIFKGLDGSKRGGLFREVNGGTVRNLIVVMEKDITTGGPAWNNNGGIYQLGGIAGIVSNGGTISQCAVISAATDPKVYQHRTKTEGTTRMRVGAIVGLLTGSSTVTQCYADVSVQGSLNATNTWIGVGGLVGEAMNSTISDSVYRGIAVEGYHIEPANSRLAVGGIVGRSENSSLSNCYTQTLIQVGDMEKFEGSGVILKSNNGASGAGGHLVGYNEKNTTVSNSYYVSSGYRSWGSWICTPKNKTTFGTNKKPESINGSWETAADGYLNLAWLLNSEALPTAKIETSDKATLTFNKPSEEKNEFSGTYDISIPYMGTMAQPQGVTVTSSYTGGTVNKITVEPADTNRPFTYPGVLNGYNVTVETPQNVGEPPVTWEVWDASNKDVTASWSMEGEGKFRVPNDYKGATATIRAICEKAGANGADVVGEYRVVVNQPQIEITSRNATKNVTTPMVVDLKGSAAFVQGAQNGISWTITGNDKPGTQITPTGVLFVATDETSQILTVTASYDGATDSQIMKLNDSPAPKTETLALAENGTSKNISLTEGEEITLKVTDGGITGLDLTKVQWTGGETATGETCTFKATRVGNSTVTATYTDTTTTTADPVAPTVPEPDPVSSVPSESKPVETQPNGTESGTEDQTSTADDVTTFYNEIMTTSVNYTATFHINVKEAGKAHIGTSGLQSDSTADAKITYKKSSASSDRMLKFEVQGTDEYEYALSPDASATYQSITDKTFSLGENEIVIDSNSEYHIYVRTKANADGTMDASAPMDFKIKEWPVAGGSAQMTSAETSKPATLRGTATLRKMTYTTGEIIQISHDGASPPVNDKDKSLLRIWAEQSKVTPVPQWAKGTIQVTNITRVTIQFEGVTYPNRFKKTGSASGTGGDVTNDPTFYPTGQGTIDTSNGVRILTEEAGTAVYYTITPDGSDTTYTPPAIGGSGRTKLYEGKPGEIQFPPNTDTFIVAAIAQVSGKRPSQVVSITYRNDTNLSPPGTPVLRVSTEAGIPDSSAYYAPGTKFYFTNVDLATGKLYYTTDGTEPSVSNGNEYTASKPGTLPEQSSVTIRGVYVDRYGNASQSSWDRLNILQKLAVPTIIPSEGATVRPGDAVRFTLSEDTLKRYDPEYPDYFDADMGKFKTITFTGTEDRHGLVYWDDEKKEYTVAQQSQITIVGDTPLQGESYLSVSTESGQTTSLPRILYAVGTDGDAAAGITYTYGTRTVARTEVEGGIPSFTVRYQNPASITAVGDPGKQFKIQALTVSHDERIVQNSAVKTYTLYMRDGMAAPTAYPATSENNPTKQKVGAKISLPTPADALIFYTTDGSSPMVRFEGGVWKVYVPQTGDWYQHSTEAAAESPTKLFDSTNPIQILTDVQQLFTIRAVAVSPDFSKENSAEVSFQYAVEALPKASAPAMAPSTSNTKPTELPRGERILLTSDEADVKIYYTLDGTAPQPATVTPGTENREPTESDQSGTFLYSSGKGVPMMASSSQTYFTISAIAADVSAQPTRSNSEVTKGVYRLARTAAPTATPSTTSDKIATVAPGTGITLGCLTPGATIYYTVDNTLPDISQAKQGTPSGSGSTGTWIYDNTKGLTMPSETKTFYTIRAVAVGAGYDQSDTMMFPYQLPAPVQAVMASPGQGEVEKGTKVELSCSTTGATIYYTIDDSDPVPYESATYKSAIEINEDTTIRAIAELNGVTSAETEYEYEIASELSPPEASVPTGSIVSKGAQITLTARRGSIAYTLDGSDPKELVEASKKSDSSSSSSGSSGGVNVTVTNGEKDDGKVYYGSKATIDAAPGESVTLRAFCYETGYTSSEVAAFTYTISGEGDYLKSVPAAESTVAPGDIITLSTGITNGRIFYTTGSETPTVSAGGDYDGSVWWEPEGVTLEGNTVTVDAEPGAIFTIRALVAANGAQAGAVEVLTYNVAQRTPAPSATIPSGAYVLKGAATELTAKEGDIFYTTDGTDPTTSSRIYSETIQVLGSMVLKAIAVADGKQPSEIVQYVYTYAGQAAAPVMSVPGGEITQGTSVALTTDTEGASIYYSTDGSEPAAGSTLYTGPISIMRAVTIKARAVKEGLDDSVINSATYTVNIPPPPPILEETEGGPRVTGTDRLQSRRTYSEDAGGPTFDDVVLTDPSTNVILSGPSESLTNDLLLTVKPIEPSLQEQETVKSQLDNEIVSLFDVTLVRGGEQVQPTGQVELGLPIPPEAQNGLITVCRILDDGTLAAYPTRRSGGVAYVMVDHFSKYAVTAAAGATAVMTLPVLALAGLCVSVPALLAIVGVTVYMRRKKKKSGGAS